MTFYWFLKHQAMLQEFIGTRSYESISSRTQWIRLGALLVFVSFVTLGAGIWNIFQRFEGGPLRPWVSWDWVHAEFDRIDQMPSTSLSQSYKNTLWGSEYLLSTSGLVTFCLLTFSRESMCTYSEAGRWLWDIMSCSTRRREQERRSARSTGPFSLPETRNAGHARSTLRRYAIAPYWGFQLPPYDLSEPLQLA